jgi:hypothetical protein
MILRHRIALNGAQLDELDERIIVAGIDEQPGRETLSAVSRFGGWGQRVTTRHRDTLDVVVRFGMRIKAKDLPGREELFEKVIAWAVGSGWMTLNYKPDRRLRVKCVQPATVGDPWAWTGEYSITFRAYGVPYWQEVNAGSVTFRGNSGVLTVNGTAKTAAEVEFGNTSGGTINAVTITCGASKMVFGSLGLQSGEVLVIDHNTEGLLRIRIRGVTGAYRSAMAARTAGSDDELWVNPGAVACSYSPSWTAWCVVRACGRWW